jgi:hypothetical protein
MWITLVILVLDVFEFGRRVCTKAQIVILYTQNSNIYINVCGFLEHDAHT